MAKALLLAWASPASNETEADFNAWYEGVHVPEVREVIPSVGAVNRYRLSPLGLDPAPDHPRYLAVYELDDADVLAAAKALGGALSGGRMTLSAAMDVAGDPPALQWYEHV